MVKIPRGAHLSLKDSSGDSPGVREAQHQLKSAKPDRYYSSAAQELLRK